MLIHRGIWLGLLDRPALQNATEVYYVTSTKYRDHAYQLSGFFPWEARALSRFFGDCRSFLVAAAGGGREVIALAKRNVHVDAFECSEELIQVSCRLFIVQKINSSIIIAQPDQVPPSLGVYDGIIVGWGAYMHIGGRNNRVRFLQQLRLHTNPGSPILLSFLTRVQSATYHKYVLAIARTVRRLRRSTESVELGDDLDPTFVHRFVQAEIADELAEGGFQLIHFSDQPYGHAVAQAV